MGNHGSFHFRIIEFDMDILGTLSRLNKFEPRAEDLIVRFFGVIIRLRLFRRDYAGTFSRRPT